MKRPQILKRKPIAQTRLFQVEQLELRFSNGVERTYERLRSFGYGAVVVVALTSDQSVVLVREYSAGMDDYQWGLPRGAIDPGEDNLGAANRELMEEAGYGARRLRYVKSLYLVPSYMERCVDVVVAEDLYAASLPGDEPEPIEVMTWPLARLGELVARADVTDSLSIAALFMIRDGFA
jgi:ADP-ribose diphosphatase